MTLTFTPFFVVRYWYEPIESTTPALNSKSNSKTNTNIDQKQTVFFREFQWIFFQKLVYNRPINREEIWYAPTVNFLIQPLNSRTLSPLYLSFTLSTVRFTHSLHCTFHSLSSLYHSFTHSTVSFTYPGQPFMKTLILWSRMYAMAILKKMVTMIGSSYLNKHSSFIFHLYYHSQLLQNIVEMFVERQIVKR